MGFIPEVWGEDPPKRRRRRDPPGTLVKREAIRRLLDHLINIIGPDRQPNPQARLYGLLLARVLLADDDVLTKEYAEQFPGIWDEG